MKLLRVCLVIVGVVAYSGIALAQTGDDWEKYKRTFVSEDGRVVDVHQGKMSHSEGQGFAMLLAVMNHDPSTFSLLRTWTVNNLQVRKGDSLFTWSWGQRPNGHWTVMDYNTATDGDLLIAYALFRAYKRWKLPEYRRQALDVIKSIRENVVLKKQGKHYVLPGYYGFSGKGQETLNPSYLILPAFREFGEHDEPGFWKQLHGDSVDFLKTAQFGRFSLPADWVKVDEHGKVTLDRERSRLFGLEAVRLFLYLSWEKRLDIFPSLKPLLELCGRLGYIPKTIDLVESSLSLEEAPGGIGAIYSRVAKEMGEGKWSRNFLEKAERKLQQEEHDYYSHTLYLLSQGN
jgi:endo-1,4-beta-D-glucanase Y